MLKPILSTAIRNVWGLNRSYCKITWDIFSKTVSVGVQTSVLPPERKITKDLISQLEGISLVNFGDERGIKIVEDAISYADQLQEVDTQGVEPLFTVLEHETLYLRDDTVQSDIGTNDLLSHSEKTCEGYYTAPVGNIPFVPENKLKLSEGSVDSEEEILKEQKNCKSSLS